MAFINDFSPGTFKYGKTLQNENSDAACNPEKRTVTKLYQINGLIAQEVKAALDKHSSLPTVLDMWHEEQAEGSTGCGSRAVIHPLIKAIQELSAEVEKLKGE